MVGISSILSFKLFSSICKTFSNVFKRFQTFSNGLHAAGYHSSKAARAARPPGQQGRQGSKSNANLYLQCLNEKERSSRFVSNSQMLNSLIPNKPIPRTASALYARSQKLISFDSTTATLWWNKKWKYIKHIQCKTSVKMLNAHCFLKNTWLNWCLKNLF